MSPLWGPRPRATDGTDVVDAVAVAGIDKRADRCRAGRLLVRQDHGHGDVLADAVQQHQRCVAKQFWDADLTSFIWAVKTNRLNSLVRHVVQQSAFCFGVT